MFEFLQSLSILSIVIMVVLGIFAIGALVLMFGRDHVAGWVAVVWNRIVGRGGGSAGALLAVIVLGGCAQAFPKTHAALKAGNVSEVFFGSIDDTRQVLLFSCLFLDAPAVRWTVDMTALAATAAGGGSFEANELVKDTREDRQKACDDLGGSMVIDTAPHDGNEG